MELIDELKKIIFLNKCEALNLTKEYFMMYLVSLLKDYNGSDKRRLLIEKLKEYYKTIKEENDYMRYLLRNIDSIKNEEKLNDILNGLDILNERTYLYFDNILKEYEDNIFFDNLERKILPYKDFQTILEDDAYLENVLGLTLGTGDLETYYTEEKEAYKYLSDNTKTLDVPVEEGMDFYGCFLKEDEKNGTLREVKLCVPRITDLETMCINISIYRCGLDLFKYIDAVLPENEKIAKKVEEERQFRKEYLNREKLYK